MVAGDEKVRMQIFASKRQHEILIEAAKAAGTDVHTYVMGFAMRGAQYSSSKGTPLVLEGDVSERLRIAAQAQGINASALVAQLLVASEGG